MKQRMEMKALVLVFIRKKKEHESTEIDGDNILLFT